MYLALEGVIGVGKTTFAQALADALRGTPVLEDFTSNPFLSRFYGAPRNYALQNQLTFAMIHYSQLLEAQRLSACGHHVVADFTFDKELAFSRLTLSQDDYRIFDSVYHHLLPRLHPPDAVILLDAPVDVVMERIAKRGRTMERAIEPSYIQALDRELRAEFAKSRVPVLRIDSEQIDIVADPSSIWRVLTAVEALLSGGQAA